MSEDLREQNRNPLAHADGAQPGASAGASDAPASGRRRHLLKAAASAGPLIATLPSGEALANASALQCVINEQENPTTLVETSDATDPYLRIDGFLVKDGSNNVIAYRITGAPFAGGDGLYVDLSGNRIDPASLPTPNTEEATQFLRVYGATNSPITGPEDVTVAVDTTPSGCEIKSGLTGYSPYPTAPDYCFYPVAAPRPAFGAPGNVALTGTCLASFS
jgi:hypothetical protein